MGESNPESLAVFSWILVLCTRQKTYLSPPLSLSLSVSLHLPIPSPSLPLIEMCMSYVQCAFLGTCDITHETSSLVKQYGKVTSCKPATDLLTDYWITPFMTSVLPRL